MFDRWNLKSSDNIHQMLRIRADKSLDEVLNSFKDLVIIKHSYHIADDIMFPDTACISFFRAFEEDYILVLEEDNRHFLYAVDINQGEMRFYLYTNDSQNSIMDSINFLKSNDFYPCEFEVILNENGKKVKDL